MTLRGAREFWAMNFNTITSELFTKAFNTWWGIWKNEIERFRNIQEWWDVTKTNIKYLTMQISKQLKKGQNKKDIEKFEKQLEDLKSRPFEHKIKSIRDFDFPL
jgi:hypothetical protein